MAFKTAFSTVSVEDWNRQVKQLGLGDTSSPGNQEIRLILDTGKYILKIYNSSTLAWEIVTIPQGSGSGLDADKYRGQLIQKGRQTVTSSGTTIYFAEQFPNNPNCHITPELSCTWYVSNRTKTQFTVYSSIASVMVQWTCIG